MAYFSTKIFLSYIGVFANLLGVVAQRPPGISEDYPWTNANNELEVLRLADACDRWPCRPGTSCYIPGNQYIEFRDFQFCRRDSEPIKWCTPPILPRIDVVCSTEVCMRAGSCPTCEVCALPTKCPECVCKEKQCPNCDSLARRKHLEVVPCTTPVSQTTEVEIYGKKTTRATRTTSTPSTTPEVMAEWYGDRGHLPDYVPREIGEGFSSVEIENFPATTDDTSEFLPTTTTSTRLETSTESESGGEKPIEAHAVGVLINGTGNCASNETLAQKQVKPEESIFWFVGFTTTASLAVALGILVVFLVWKGRQISLEIERRDITIQNLRLQLSATQSIVRELDKDMQFPGIRQIQEGVIPIARARLRPEDVSLAEGDENEPGQSSVARTVTFEGGEETSRSNPFRKSASVRFNLSDPPRPMGFRQYLSSINLFDAATAAKKTVSKSVVRKIKIDRTTSVLDIGKMSQIFEPSIAAVRAAADSPAVDSVELMYYREAGGGGQAGTSADTESATTADQDSGEPWYSFMYKWGRTN